MSIQVNSCVVSASAPPTVVLDSDKCRYISIKFANARDIMNIFLIEIEMVEIITSDVMMTKS